MVVIFPYFTYNSKENKEKKNGEILQPIVMENKYICFDPNFKYIGEALTGEFYEVLKDNGYINGLYHPWKMDLIDQKWPYQKQLTPDSDDRDFECGEISSWYIRTILSNKEKRFINKMYFGF